MKSHVCALAMLLLAIMPANGCTKQFDPTATDARLKTLLQRAVFDVDPSGQRHAVLGIQGPVGYAFEGAAGTARVDTGEPMTTAHQFAIASVAKTMIAVLVYQLWEEGALGPGGLDATLGELGVLPPEVIDSLSMIEGISYGRSITIRHLLTHTSGLRCLYFDDERSAVGLMPGTADGAAPDSLVGRVVYDPTRGLDALLACTMRGAPAGCDPQDYLLSHHWSPWDEEAWRADPTDRMAGLLNLYLSGMNLHAIARPGAAFHYADTNYLLLGLLIEKATGIGIQKSLRSRIFDHLDMTHTYLRYAGSTESDETHLADVWAWNAPMMSGQVNLSFEWVGAIVSTIDDLHTFVKALAAGRLFKYPHTLAEMLKVPESIRGLSYASGLVVFPADSGQILHLAGSNGTWVDYHTAHDLTVIGSVDDFHGVMHQVNFRGDVYKILDNSGLIGTPIRAIPSMTVRIISGISALVLIIGMAVWLSETVLRCSRRRPLTRLVRRTRAIVVGSALIHGLLAVIAFLLVSQEPVQVMFGFTPAVRAVMNAAWYIQMAAAAIVLLAAVHLWLKTQGRPADRATIGLVAVAGAAYAWALGAMGLM